MRLKSFHGKNMQEAMSAVRDVMGDDAIIVSMRDEEGGVRITAAVDENAPVKEDPLLSQSDIEETLRLNLSPFQIAEPTDHTDALVDLLYRHGVPGRVADEMTSAAMNFTFARDLKSLLTSVLEKLLPFESAQPAGKPVLLVGPPGVGKTLTTAKLAAQAHMQGQRVTVLTTDTIRAGGVEQLEAFTRALGLDLIAAESAGALADGIEAMRDQSDLILIDSAGFNPFDMKDVSELVLMIKAIGGLNAVDTVLVLPAGIDAAEAQDIANVYQKLGIKRLIMTRLDCARRLGGVITACMAGPFQLLALSQSARVADGVQPLSAAAFAEILLQAPKGAS